MPSAQTVRLTDTRIPTDDGEFRLCLYENPLDDEDHLAVIMGEVNGRDQVLVRVHSECFTGDVLGSRRCDCGEQLNRSLRAIAAAGSGILIYLRQEGRGIGLLEKMRAYQLQDEGYDTVDANLVLGHAADGRDYTVAGLILQDLGVRGVRLLTNNPDKVAGMEACGIPVRQRVPLEAEKLTADTAAYLHTKATRMRHLLNPDQLRVQSPNGRHTPSTADDLLTAIARDHAAAAQKETITVTVSYAQTLDGAIAVRQGVAARISNANSYRLVHRLRAAHDAILVGRGTAVADNPRLTARDVPGDSPVPVVLDGRLQLAPTAELFATEPYPLIYTTPNASVEREQALCTAGATVIRLPADENGRLPLPAVLTDLARRGLSALMVEGGGEILRAFFASGLVDRAVITIAPRWMGGYQLLDRPLDTPVQLHQPQHLNIHGDMVLWGRIQPEPADE